MMKTLWKILARRYLAQLVAGWFREEGPDLLARLRKIGLSAASATMVLALVEAWLMERANKV